jgi:hypothetical protein
MFGIPRKKCPLTRRKYWEVWKLSEYEIGPIALFTRCLTLELTRGSLQWIGEYFLQTECLRRPPSRAREVLRSDAVHHPQEQDLSEQIGGSPYNWKSGYQVKTSCDEQINKWTGFPDQGQNHIRKLYFGCLRFSNVSRLKLNVEAVITVLSYQEKVKRHPTGID